LKKFRQFAIQSQANHHPCRNQNLSANLAGHPPGGQVACAKPQLPSVDQGFYILYILTGTYQTVSVVLALRKRTIGGAVGQPKPLITSVRRTYCQRSQRTLILKQSVWPLPFIDISISRAADTVSLSLFRYERELALNLFSDS